MLALRKTALALIPALATPLLAQTPAGTAFKHQGELIIEAVPANGVFDLQFALHDAETDGSQLEPTLIIEDVRVTGGEFVVRLDFGDGVFGGDARWLEVAFRPGEEIGDFAVVTPREELTPVPSAIFGQGAPWSGITDKPAGFQDDEDNDTLGKLNCAQGQVPHWAGTEWICLHGAAGDIEGVTAGPGLIGGGISGDVTLSVNFGGSGSASSAARSDHNHFGARWTGSANPGLEIENRSSGDGVRASSSGVGVMGSSTSTFGTGVRGVAVATTGQTRGVEGLSFSTSGRGVRGWARAASGFTAGVEGSSDSRDGRGVFGEARARLGNAYGVFGRSSSVDGGAGIRGEGTLRGVWGSTLGIGVGVEGNASQTGGTAVFGWAARFATYGVRGQADSPSGYGGYFVNTQGGTALRVSGGRSTGRIIDSGVGAYLSFGGVWVNRSDAAAKENVEPVEGRDILERLARLPITSWNYKGERASVRHLGPTAQDFHAVFGFGGDDKTISTVDPAGIALAAIQQLHRELGEKTAALESLRAELEELRSLVKSIQGSAEKSSEPQRH